MNERLRKLRKELGLNGTEFGAALGIQPSAVSKIELGTTQLTEANIKLICATNWPNNRRVSEHWLRTGEGNMFVETSVDDEIMAYVSKLANTPDAILQKRLLLMMSRLTDEQWTFIAKTMRALTDQQETPVEDQQETSAVNNQSTEAAEAAYREALGIAPSTKSSASNTSGATDSNLEVG